MGSNGVSLIGDFLVPLCPGSPTRGDGSRDPLPSRAGTPPREERLQPAPAVRKASPTRRLRPSSYINSHTVNPLTTLSSAPAPGNRDKSGYKYLQAPREPEHDIRRCWSLLKTR